MSEGCAEPLLTSSENIEGVVDDEGTSVTDECKRVLSIALPITASQSLSFLSYLITTAQVGSLGPQALSALTLGRSIFHVTGLSLVVGIASGVGTLGGQAYGAGQYSLVGTVTQRAVLLNLMMCSLIFLAWTQLTSLMEALGQDPNIATLSSRYVLSIFPALVLEAIMNCLQIYLSSQEVTSPLTVVAAVMTLCTPITNYVLIDRLDMGLDGAALSYNLVNLLGCCVMVGSVWLLTARWQAHDQKTWPSWSRSSFSGWGQYLKVALPSLAMICAVWWVFEAVILIAGQGKDAEVQLSVMGILFSTHTVVYMINEGFSAASSTRVSNLLGEGRSHRAQGATIVCLILTVTCDIVAAASFLVFSKPWAQLFSSDEGVVEGTVRSMPWLAAALLIDGTVEVLSASLPTLCFRTVEVLSGVLRGSGRQALGFYANIVSCWIVGMPLAWYWGGLTGSVGLWQALAAMTVIQALVIGGAVAMFDWPEEARRAQARVEEGAASLHCFSPLLPDDPCLESSNATQPKERSILADELIQSKTQRWPHQHHGTHDMIISGSL
ncbi:hypothetical protein CEUSTIGMA_g6523.t1 [Chlamydomonas eustigma]|uniref:Protein DETOXIFICATION n=1 Tax=Chlamydomonas eustigma TaxID=1157962 RepID=A0A250X7M7_9CHLO|nr:hypothetical protein CEUSTIGMA_g6523.t1 [Chlamydomonas eustigma]|eukprot:GAX79083.1 hypothetical protein CEUSTIGMA_g6523.t1 [Chlamydomonas eustigma]